MPRLEPAPLIEAELLGDVLLERYSYGPGPPSDIARHVHDTYQIGLALDRAGEYRYLGSTEPVPTRGLVIIHPGEPHAVRDRGPRNAYARYLMLYLEAELVRSVAQQRGGRRAIEPFFRHHVFDADLVDGFTRLFSGACRLEREGLLLTVVDGLVGRHGDAPSPDRAPAGARPGIARALAYLHDSPHTPASLAELADVAGLSRYHFVRAFAAHVGAPPHAYLRQLRIDRAKRLLASGEVPGRVALRTGFYDQSHFGRHFRRIVGSTPRRYVPVAPHLGGMAQ